MAEKFNACYVAPFVPRTIYVRAAQGLAGQMSQMYDLGPCTQANGMYVDTVPQLDCLV